MTGPIRHIVMWRVRGDTPEERTRSSVRVKAAFEGLVGRIEGLTHMEIGLDISAVDYACDVVLISQFTDSAALAAYATHPEHLRVRRELGDIRIARFQVDYPVSPLDQPAAPAPTIRTNGGSPLSTRPHTGV